MYFQRNMQRPRAREQPCTATFSQRLLFSNTLYINIVYNIQHIRSTHISHSKLTMLCTRTNVCNLYYTRYRTFRYMYNLQDIVSLQRDTRASIIAAHSIHATRTFAALCGHVHKYANITNRRRRRDVIVETMPQSFISTCDYLLCVSLEFVRNIIRNLTATKLAAVGHTSTHFTYKHQTQHTNCAIHRHVFKSI